MLSAEDLHANTWLIHCDGASLPNPGRIGIGAVLTAPDGTHHTLSQATGIYGCNNEAEVRALIAALHELTALGCIAANTYLRVHCDSSILVEQLGSTSAAPIARLVQVFDEARQLLKNFRHVDLKWVPRHRNSEADALARAALGLASKAGLRPRPRKRYAR